ncbi:MAG: Gfo/Idh/MocA family protein [Pseudonocardiaceae bacterium]
MESRLMEPLRIGIVGLGVIAPFYLAALERVPALHLAAVCDLDEEVLRPFRDPGSGRRVPYYRDHRDLLWRAEVDAVVVTVPNHAHAEVCQDVLEAGLPVCVEKPLATELADGELLVRSARVRSLTLFTAFHRRYNAAVVALVRALEGKDVPIDTVTIRYLERIEDHVGRDRWYLDPARCGGGCVADNGPNAYDLARLLVGSVHVAEADIIRDADGVDRQARVLLHADSGVRVRVELDWSYPGERKDIEVRLADGTVHRADMLRGYPGFTQSPGFKQSLWHEYVGVLADFTEAVHAGATRAEGGLAALSLVHETYRVEEDVMSSAEGE